MATRDVVIAIFSCPGIVPDKRCTCNNMIKEFWADDPASAPLVLHVEGGLDSAGYVAANTFSTTDANGNPVQSFLKPFLKSQRLHFASGETAGRICLIGFSQGCNGVGKILKLPFDREMLDMVVAVDGPAGSYSPPATYKDNDQAAAAILPASYAHWVAFAMDAAQNDGASPPKRTMVLTYSLGGPNSNQAASTKATVTAILNSVLSTASNISPPCLVPLALIGAAPDAIDPPGPWPSSWNHCGGGKPGVPCDGGGSCPCNTMVQPPWPVEWQSTNGNLICVGFNARSNKEASCGMTCSESAHEFQAFWVHRQIWKDVIRPHWKEACTHEIALDEPVGTAVEQAAGWSGLGTTPRAPATIVEQVGTTFLRRSVKNMRFKATGGLGEDASCGYEGVFANLFAPGEWEALTEGVTAAKAVVFILGVAAGAWIADHLLKSKRR